MNDFLPNNYEAPASSADRYLKIPQDAKNAVKVRIMSSAITGWIDWDRTGEKPKPVRTEHEETPLNPGDDQNQPKHFWACVVWNYNSKRFEIWEITQKGIQKEISKFMADEDWGDPKGYDLKLYKEGEKKNTKYFITPSNKSNVSDDIFDAYADTSINLNNLFENKDPFEKNELY